METLTMEMQSTPGLEIERAEAASSTDERTYTLPEAAELAGMSIGTLWTLIRDRRLAANVKPGSYGLEYRIRADALAGLQGAERVRVPAQPSPPPTEAAAHVATIPHSGAVPTEAVAQAAAPQMVAPQMVASPAVASPAVVSQAAAPQMVAPQAAAPQMVAPQAAAPQVDMAELQMAREAAARGEARAAELERLVTALESHIADLRGQLDSANDGQTALRQLLSALQAQLIRQR